MTNNNNSNLLEEQLNKISQRAKRDSAIKLQDLTYIMAADESYNDILPELWDKFDLNKANRIPQLNYENGRLDKNGNLKFKEDRVGAWWWVWARLAIITEIDEFYFKELPPVINSLPLYYFTRGELIKVEDGNKRKEDHFVKLDDLEAFIKNIEEKYSLNIPLPTRLFPDHKDKITAKKALPEEIKPGEEIPGKEIMDKHRIKDFQLLDCIREEGIDECVSKMKNKPNPYRAKLQPFSPSSLKQIEIQHHLMKPSEHDIENDKLFKENEFNPNYDIKVKRVEYLLPHIPKLIFKKIEVEETLKKYGLYQPNEITSKRPIEQRKAIFPCEPGTKWEDITITLIANDTVRIKTPQDEGRFTYHELGLSDKRRGDEPKKALWGLFKLFAEKNGFVSPQNVRYDPRRADTAKRLNKHLQEVFRIQDSIYQGHYRKEKGYRTKIKFSDARQSTIISTSTDEDEFSQDIIDTFKETGNLDMERIGASKNKRPPQD